MTKSTKDSVFNELDSWMFMPCEISVPSKLSIIKKDQIFWLMTHDPNWLYD